MNMLGGFCLQLCLILLLQKSVNSSRNDVQEPPYDDENSRQCSPISQPICKGLRYTMTKMPNHANLPDQEQAAKRMNDYRSLINAKCSHYLKFFLCTVYFPMCADIVGETVALKPCKDFCTHVKSRCIVYLEALTFPWPADLACENLPSEGKLCIHPQNYDHDSNLKVKSIDDLKQIYNPSFRDKEIFPDIPNLPEGILNTKFSTCSPAEIKVAYEKNGTCLTRCSANLLFRGGDKKFAKIWMTVWATLCAISTGLTILTFICENARFRYPERPIIYLAACYFFYSLAYILRAGMGAEKIGCRRIDKASESFLVKSGHEGTWCTIIFLVLYFFGMAGALWWVMLTLTWFLSAARKWGYEGVEAISSVFHMIAWAIPAIKTFVILIMHRIDADELTGMCFVGNQDRQSLLIFVIIPLLIYLVIGSIFLTFGFCSLFTVRQDLKQDGSGNIRRLEKLMAKIGIFSVLYCLPAICVLGSYVYEFMYLPKWQRNLQNLRLRKNCLVNQGLNWQNDHCTAVELPFVEVYMLKIFMSLVVGITSGMWVWCNKKTFNGWLRCFQRRLCHEKGVGVGQKGIHQQDGNPGAAVPLTSTVWPPQPSSMASRGTGGFGPSGSSGLGMATTGVYQPPSYATVASKSVDNNKYMSNSCV